MMIEHLSDEVDIIATHPLFGPDSFQEFQIVQDNWELESGSVRWHRSNLQPDGLASPLPGQNRIRLLK